LAETCRFCKQQFPKEAGNFYYGNFVCNNCVDIIDAALEKKHVCDRCPLGVDGICVEVEN
jgi:hypothetical protein